jgi:hypothetical protein
MQTFKEDIIVGHCVSEVESCFAVDPAIEIVSTDLWLAVIVRESLICVRDKDISIMQRQVLDYGRRCFYDVCIEP